MKRLFTLIFVLALGSAAVLNAQVEATTVSSSLDWKTLSLDITVSENLKEAGILLPAGRTRADDILDQAYTASLPAILGNIRVNSTRTLSDFEKNLTMQSFISSTVKLPSYLDDGWSKLEARYSLDLSSTPARLQGGLRQAEPNPPLTAVSSADFSGLIIVASGSLPVHGRNAPGTAVPCLCPKIWDSDMNLLYNQRVHYAGQAEIFENVPSGLSKRLQGLIGTHPLRIFADALFGETPTDLIIDKADALLITGNADNMQLLKNGKVVVVINDSALGAP